MPVAGWLLNPRERAESPREPVIAVMERRLKAVCSITAFAWARVARAL